MPMEAWHGITAALTWLATLTAALHLRQPREARSWWQTGSGTIQFLVLLSLTVSAIIPQAPTPWSRPVLILIGVLPLLLLGEALWLSRRAPPRRLSPTGPPAAPSNDVPQYRTS